MEAGKEQIRGKGKGAPWSRPEGCQTAPFLTLHTVRWPCPGLERSLGRAGLSLTARWSLLSLGPPPILH